jgi:arabinogalactan endo-1,4-beta-galactosidase
LYPVGEISSNGIHPTSELLRSAIEGAKAAGFLGKTMIHLANAWDGNDVSWFFSSVFVRGALAPADVDMIGLSYYPFYDTRATLDALNSSLTNLANTVGKPIVIVETNWPVACPNVALSEPSIPVSVIGQEIW